LSPGWCRRVLTLAATAVVFTACASSDTDEEQRIKEAVSSFLQEAYAPAGDIDFAYSLLAEETRQTCSKADFTAIALAARQANGDRSLQADRFADLRISGDRATLQVDSDYDLSPRYFPVDATVVREEGEWRYLVTTDPTCKSVPRFFQHEDAGG
jgi:hypothetical protein